MTDLDTIFVLTFTDGGAAAVLREFEDLSEAIHLAEVCNRLCEIREIGRDTFTDTKINRLRYVMKA